MYVRGLGKPQQIGLWPGLTSNGRIQTFNSYGNRLKEQNNRKKYILLYYRSVYSSIFRRLRLIYPPKHYIHLNYIHSVHCERGFFVQYVFYDPFYEPTSVSISFSFSIVSVIPLLSLSVRLFFGILLFFLIPLRLFPLHFSSARTFQTHQSLSFPVEFPK